MPRLPVETYSALLIEDSPTSALITKTMLDSSTQSNWIFTHAPTLFAGLQCLERGTFDVVCLDLNLPNGAGLAQVVAPVLKASGSIPVVVVTSEVDEATKLAAQAMGVQGYWRKSLDWKCRPFHDSVIDLIRARNLVPA